MNTFRARLESVAVVAVLVLGYTAAAWASGWPPFAVPDSIDVFRGGTAEVLTSGANSVLANDFDLERDPLTAILTKDAKHGSLTLREDGTFTYRHDGSGGDKDEFKYRAFDGTGFSSEATVSISVVDIPNSPPFVVSDVPDQVATAGLEFRLVLAVNFADPDEGDVLTYSIDGLPRSGSLQLDPALGILSGTPVADDIRDRHYDIKVTATDRQGLSASLEFDLTVIRFNEPPVVISPVPDQEAVEGIAFSLDLAAYFRDPDDGDSLRYSATGLPASGALQLNAASGQLSGTPTLEDTRDEPYSVSVRATDTAGATATANFELLVLRDNRSDVVLTVALASNPVTVGEDAWWNIDVTNKGPADLQDGQLFAGWATSGPPLTITAPDGCVVAANGTSAPTMDCALGPVAAGTSQVLTVQGLQDGDGDNSVLAFVSADDPNPDDNQYLASAAVVEAFSEGPAQIVDVLGTAVKSGDLDQDGAVDVVATGAETIVFFNNGNRAVATPGRSLGADSGGSSLALLEWNGDGFTDIAVGGLNGRSVEVFVNDGSGGFGSAASLQGGVVASVSDLLAVDVEGDGLSELLATGSGGTAILKRAAAGGIEAVPLASGAGRDLATADFDQDGDQDFVVVLAADRRVELLYNAGDGTIAGTTPLQLGSVANVSAGDLNGDGAPDLLVAIDGDDMSPPQNRVLYQQGGGEFALAQAFGASPVTALIPGDINADGWQDIVAVNHAGVHQQYLGSQGGGFSLAPEQIVSAGMQQGVLSDFNGDDSLDLIMVGSAAAVLEIYANNGIGRLGLGDRIGPEITLIGEASVTIPAGGEYLDPGATAIDDIDGDITEKIEVSGSIDSTVVGTQSLTYTVADRAGNRTSVTRTVIVGVNEGTGGGGGGHLAPLFVLALLCAIAARRRRQSG